MHPWSKLLGKTISSKEPVGEIHPLRFLFERKASVQSIWVESAVSNDELGLFCIDVTSVTQLNHLESASRRKTEGVWLTINIIDF